MKLKKILALGLSALMMFSLVGCGGGATKEEQKTEQPPAGETQSAGNELTVWCWDPAFNIFAMKEAEKDYNKNHSDKPIKLNIVEVPWNDLQTKLTTLSTSKQLDKLPDIFLLQDNAFQKNFSFDPEMFTDITDSGVDFSKFAKSKVAYSTVDGKNYAVPFDNGAVINAVRTDILKEAGFTPKDLSNITWDRYIEIGKQVKEKTGKPMLSVSLGDPDFIMMILQSCGASLFKEDGSLDIQDNKVLKDTIELYSKLVKEGILKEVNSWDEYVGDFTSGNTVSTINGCWILGSVQTAKDQSGKWAVVDMPKLYADDPKSTNYSNNGGSSWVISKTSKNKDLAIDFLKSTFAGSVDFYNEILPPSGAIATYLPAKEAPAYSEPQKFFNDQKIYVDILDFASKVPSNITGVYYYEARNAVSNAIVNYVKGSTSLEDGLKAANDEVEFKMGK